MLWDLKIFIWGTQVLRNEYYQIKFLLTICIFWDSENFAYGTQMVWNGYYNDFFSNWTSEIWMLWDLEKFHVTYTHGLV